MISDVLNVTVSSEENVFNPLTPTVAICLSQYSVFIVLFAIYTAIKHIVPDWVKPSFVIFDIWTLWCCTHTATLNSGRQRVNLSLESKQWQSRVFVNSSQHTSTNILHRLSAKSQDHGTSTDTYCMCAKSNQTSALSRTFCLVYLLTYLTTTPSNQGNSESERTLVVPSSLK